MQEMLCLLNKFELFCLLQDGRKLKEINMNKEFNEVPPFRWMKFLTPVCHDCDKL